MRYLSLLFCSLLSLPFFAQSSSLTVTATGCPAMQLFRFNGASFDKEADLVQENGQYTLDLNYDEAKFRYLGPKASDALPIILAPGESASVTATCGRMRNSKVTNSPANVAYQDLKKSFQLQNGRTATATRAYQAANQKRDSAAMQQQLQSIMAIDNEKRKTLAQMKQDHPLLGRIAAVNTYESFLVSNKGRFPNELDYFVNTYFQYVDFQDAGYNDLPWTYEGSRNFVNTLAKAVRGENLGNILLQVYERWPEGSQARLFAYSGAFASLLQAKHPAASFMADRIIEQYATSAPDAVAQIKQQAASLRSFAVGAEAPAFAGPSPEGETIALESLRGKVVLIDFWASWCGPCRRENPNVVKLYEKYKDKGFEILAVSLDSNRDRWLKAIATDKLTWLHISELKGWKGDISRQYGVSSIPQTVLLDAEGRILARNLRGATLERKLEQVFAGSK